MTCKAKDFDRICQFCIYCLRNAVFLPFLSSYNNDQRLFKICYLHMNYEMCIKLNYNLVAHKDSKFSNHFVFTIYSSEFLACQ